MQIKPINEMTLDELSEYAVTFNWWDWTLIGGAKTKDGLRLALWGDHNDVFVAGPDDENGWSEGQVVGVSTLGSYVDSYYLHEGIDLNDNATLGCVLAMVRKKHGYGCVTHYDLELDWGVYDREGGLIVGQGGKDGSASQYFTEEAHALIAALAKEAE